ncbi:MAG: hypothetical protein RR336_01795 [Oscillospiraceae bacterium]
MERYLMILEVSQKQAYIFGSKKLSENAARSEDIRSVTGSDFFADNAPQLYSEAENLVYSGGGHTVLQFATMTAAQTFSRKISLAVMQQYPGLELFVKIVPYAGDKSPGENLTALSGALEQKKARRSAAFRQGSFGVEALGSDFRPTEHEPKVRARRTEPELLGGYLCPKEFEELVGNDSFLSVVHADGNGMGTRVQGVYAKSGDDWETCRAALQAFSGSIDRDFADALAETANALGTALGLAPGDILPLRRIIGAGDDVCFVTKGELGLSCAVHFLNALAVKQNDYDGLRYSACAGVTMIHKKYPFHRAYNLTEELCSSAKKYGLSLKPDGSVSALDWHMDFGELKENLAVIREDYRTDDGGYMTLRPMALGENGNQHRRFADFAETCRGLQMGNINRSKLKGLREAFHQGQTESEYEIRRMNLTSAMPQTFEDCDDGARCLYFDAVELMDHAKLLEGEGWV